MANNFRIAGATYTAKSGSDSNNGTSPNTPKATIAGGLSVTGANQTLVVGTGMFEESFTCSNSFIAGDGIVIFRGNGANNVAFNNSCIVSGVRSIENYVNMNCQAANHTWDGIIFNGLAINYTGTPGTISFTNCIFINCSFNLISGTTNNANFQRCIFIACSSDYIIGTFLNNYVDSASLLKFASGITAANFDYNNIEGNITMQSGAAAGTAQNLASHKASYSTFNVHSFSGSPQFNNIAKLDFTLQSASPNLASGQGGINIGGTKYAISKPIYTAPEWQVANGAIWTNVALTGQDLLISSGSSGSITSAPMLISTTQIAIKNLYYNGLLAFNKSQSGGSATNNNVPDAAVYAGNDASGGGNPDRLVCEIRWSTGSAVPATNADWDNTGLTPTGGAGTWVKILIVGQPFIDLSEKGNGEPGYNASTKQQIVCTYVQYRYTLTNSYL